MTSSGPPLCVECARRARDAGWTCEAFPNGIPPAVMLNRADHRQPIDGDGGLQFVPRDAKAAPRAQLRTSS